MGPRINIEDKHTYFTTPQRSLEISIRDQNETMEFLARPIVNQFLYPTAGVDENQRVGRKIQTTSLMSEGYIYLNNDQGYNSTPYILTVPFYQAFYGQQENLTNPQVLPGYLGNKAVGMNLTPTDGSYILNPLQENFDITIRHFIIEFNDTDFIELDDAAQRNYILDWYNYLVIQTSTLEPSSNSMQILRESTPYTGTFKILYDKTHHLTKTNPVLHYSYTIPYKRHLNFDAQGSEIPTNKIVVEVFIPATNYKLDFGNSGFGNYLYSYTMNFLTLQNAPTLILREAFINSTLKLKYMDM